MSTEHGGDESELEAVISFQRFLATLPRWVLRSRTSFSSFLARSFHTTRQGSCPATAIFPLPVPFHGIFNKQRTPKLSSKKWRTLVMRRAVHVLVIALNYIHNGLKSVPVTLLGRRPNQVQLAVYKHLQALLIACEKPGVFAMPPGRSGFEFIAKLVELEHFAGSHPAFKLDYCGAAEDLPQPVKKAGRIEEEHRFRVTKQFSPVNPYRSLDAGRLKLSGGGAWDMQQYLEGILWLPFVDPSILAHGDESRGVGPDFRREDPEEHLKLVRIWDAKGLLAIFPEPHPSGLACRVFNAHKSEEVDRQIGDRRWFNSHEYHPRGPSAYLPSGVHITSIHCPKGKTLIGCASDRKDFNHQTRVSVQRAFTNILPFPFKIEDVPKGDAYQEMLARLKEPRSRLTHGDQYGQPKRKAIKEKDIVHVHCGFKSLFQGDHLGVEFALESHASLLKRSGLLIPEEEILAHHPMPAGPVWQGLVIDDFFSISCERADSDPQSAVSVARLDKAEAAYSKAGVFGSDEKTVRGAEDFKVIGAEISSNPRARGAGVVTVGAPVSKRVPIAALSLRVAALPVISRALASRLAGNWVSVLMFRRCFGCVLARLFEYGTHSAKDADDVLGLQRRAAEELVLASIFSLISVTDVSAPYSPYVYATDASNSKGAFTRKHISKDLAEIIWRGGDKKGAYTMLDPPARAQLRGLGFDADGEPLPMDFISPPKVLDFAFDLVEICGGSGTLSSAAAELGLRVCTPIDLSNSPHHDMRNPKLLHWIFQMIHEGRFRSVVCEPPCTTFSIAQHPALRSHQVPLGFDRQEPRTWLGNLLAFRCFAILWFCWREAVIALLETPHLSKMAWLRFWKYLLSIGFEEAVINSCAFGSIHKKPFRLLGHGLPMESLNVPCPGGHEHVKVEGQYTKASAVYHPALAEYIARQIYKALALRSQDEQPEKPCHESVVLNDLLSQDGWETAGSWSWKQPCHINILESRSFVSLERELLLGGGNCRFTALLDSRVAKGAHAKGRSSSFSMRPSLLRSCSLQAAGNLHPSYGFAPTRLNTADAPSRDKELPPPARVAILEFLSSQETTALHALQFSRATANWIRLFLVAVICSRPVEACGLWSPPEALSGFLRDFGFFTLTLAASLTIAAILWTFGISLLRLLAISSALGNIVTPNEIGINRWGVQVHFVALVFFSCPAGAMPLFPGSRDETDRAARRSGTVLQADRVVLQSTRDKREQLLQAFDVWLVENLRITLDAMLDVRCADPEFISEALVSYGKELYSAGKSYGRFSETINAVTSRRPFLRRQVTAAWDLAFNWSVDEPHEHHSAMPLSILLAICALSLLWGWAREACVFATAWTGVLRVGEITAATRGDLVLPRDAAPGVVCALLKIRQPKTRGRAARHQSSRIEPQDVVALLDAVYGRVPSSEKLWLLSPATLRKRFSLLQSTIGLISRDGKGECLYSLSSLRPGGATHWLSVTEDAEYVRRKGRWVSSKVLEIYLQEVTVINLHPEDVR